MRHTSADITRSVLSEVLNIPLGTVSEDTSMFNQVSWTSLAHMSLIARLEEISGSPVDGDLILSLTNYTAISKFVESWM